MLHPVVPAPTVSRCSARPVCDLGSVILGQKGGVPVLLCAPCGFDHVHAGVHAREATACGDAEEEGDDLRTDLGEGSGADLAALDDAAEYVLGESVVEPGDGALQREAWQGDVPVEPSAKPGEKGVGLLIAQGPEQLESHGLVPGRVHHLRDRLMSVGLRGVELGDEIERRVRVGLAVSGGVDQARRSCIQPASRVKSGVGSLRGATSKSYEWQVTEGEITVEATFRLADGTRATGSCLTRVKPETKLVSIRRMDNGDFVCATFSK